MKKYMFFAFLIMAGCHCNAPVSVKKADTEAQNLIGDKEENCRQEHHHEDQNSGNGGFAARRPSDLGHLGADLLQECIRTGFCHDLGTCRMISCWMRRGSGFGGQRVWRAAGLAGSIGGR